MNNFYELIDSGEGEKLERFGSKLIRRPSTVCIWSKRQKHLWEKSDAAYDPKSDGWKLKQGLARDITWQTIFAGSSLNLRLQENGQLGVFPEHASYLPLIDNGISLGKGDKILNLFAYTGLASLYFRSKQTDVTHVDLSKKVISWAKDNVELQNKENKAGKLSDVRWICDDAVAFLKREVRRNSSYQGVIVDPPSFSRISKNDFWKVADILQSLVKDCASLLKESGKFMVLTCHDPGISAPMLANLLIDTFKEGKVSLLELSIPEKDSTRLLPAGSSAIWKLEK